MNDAKDEVGACLYCRGIWTLKSVVEWDMFGGRQTANKCYQWEKHNWQQHK
jgi:hypothetical protein